MNICKQCGQTTADKKLCEKCIEACLKATPSKYGYSADSKLFNYLPYLIGILLLTGFLIYPRIFGYGQLPQTFLKPVMKNNFDPCWKKERCIIVYLAPWCPSCTAAKSFLIKAREKIVQNKKVGIKLIIGSAEESSLLKMAASFGNQVYLDTKSEFSQAVGIRGVPSLLITDINGKIIDRDLSAHLVGNMPEDELIDFWLQNTLGLGKYFKN